MAQSKLNVSHSLSIEQLQGVNLLIENEPDRSFCRKLLNKVPISDLDVLDYRNTHTRKFLENCANYNISVPATVIGRNIKNDLVEQTKNLHIRTHKNKFMITDYIVSDWVKIDRLLIDINSLSKGEQHRNIKQLVLLLNDKWCSTFYHNSNNDCRRLITKLDNLKIESRIKTMSQFQKKMKYYYKIIGSDRSHKDFVHEYEDQMFSTFVSMKEDILTTAKEIKLTAQDISNFVKVDLLNKTEAIEKTFGAFSSKFDKVTMNSEILTGKFLKIMDSWESNSSYLSFFMTIIKFVSFAYLASQKQNQTAANLSALITLILPTGIGNIVLTSLSRAVLGIISCYRDKHRDETVEQGWTPDEEISMNFGSAFLQTVGLLIKSVFTSIDTKAFNSIKANTFYFKNISDLIRSCTTIVDFMIKAISTTVDFVISKIMEYYGMLPAFLKDDDFNNLIDEYIEMKKDDTFLKCDEDIISARKVIVLRNKILTIEQTMNKAIIKNKDLVYKVAPYIRIIAATLDKAYDSIPPHFKDDANAHRKKPYFIYIHGKPRIGKSKIFQPLLVNAIAKRLKFIDDYQDPQHYCCFRTPGREFWDGGQGKKVIWYNDVFQTMMADQTLDLAIDELGSVVDDNPYHMNMSDVKDKSRFYLTAPLVVANGQADFSKAGFVNSRMWSNGEHLARRRDINCELILKTTWANPDGGVNHFAVNEFVKMYPNKCYGDASCKMFPNDMYIVRFYDVKSGNALFEKSFAAAIEYICKDAESYINRQNDITDLLIKNMKTTWAPTQTPIISTGVPNAQTSVTQDQMYTTGQMYAHTQAQGYQTDDDVNRHAYGIPNELANEHSQTYTDTSQPVVDDDIIQPDVQTISDQEDFIEEEVKQYLRPARTRRLKYSHNVHTKRSEFRKRATQAHLERLEILREKEQALYRPVRRKFYVKDKDATEYYSCEDNRQIDDQHVYDGSCQGSYYSAILTDAVAGGIANYLALTISSHLTQKMVVAFRASTYNWGLDKLIDMYKREHHTSALMSIISLALAQTGMVMYATIKVNNAIYTRVFPYCAWIVQSLLTRGIHRTFVTIEDIIVYGFQHPDYYYNNFIDFVYNSRDNILHTVFDLKDSFIDSYYACAEIYSNLTIDNVYKYAKYTSQQVETHIKKTIYEAPKNIKSAITRSIVDTYDYLDEFAKNAKKAFTSSYQSFKDFMGAIPGWAYLIMGATLLGGVSFLIYKMFQDDKNSDQSHEGNAKAARRRIQRKLIKKSNNVKVEEHSYNNTNVEIQNIIKHNYAHIRMETEVNGVWIKLPLAGMALNLKSNIFVIPFHYWYRFHHCHNLYSEKGYQSRLLINWSIKSQTVVYFDSITVCKLDYGHSRDLVFFRAKGVCCGRDISKFFATEAEHDQINLIDTYLFGFRERGEANFATAELMHLGAVNLIEKSYDTKLVQEPIFNSIIPSHQIVYETCYQYSDCMSAPGDCTMAFMHTDSRFNAKILGVHTAGNQEKQSGLAAPIYREDIDEVTEFFSDTEPVISLTIDQQYADYVSEISDKAHKYIDKGFTVLCNTNTIDVNGKRKRICASLPTKNKVQESLVHDVMNTDFGPTTVMPSALRRGRDESGELVSPFELAFNKMNNSTNGIPQNLHDDLVESCTDAILSWPSQWNKRNARLLTWDESINGFMNLKGLDLTTSSGFPYTMTAANKKKWFDFDTIWHMKPELLTEVERMENMLIQGQIPPVYFVDTLKDETRPIKKVKAFSSRLFQVGNMAWTIIFRRYFGWFLGHCQSTYEFGEMMSGINPNSMDWDLLARRMLNMGEDHANGDFQFYDSTLAHQACEGLNDTTTTFYEQGNCREQDNIVRKGLILGSINTMHIVEDFIIFRRQGNPSGFLLTTLLNNFANMYYHRYAFVKTTGMSLRDFKKFVFSIFFGDDSDLTIDRQIVSKFNMKTIALVLKDLGLYYTAADKSGILRESLPIQDITFLKRKFIFNKDLNVWQSQLDHTVIMEIARWSESDPNNVRDQMNRFNSTLLELGNYTKEEFENVRGIFKGYIRELNIKGFNYNVDDLFTHHYVMHLIFPSHYPSTIPYSDLASLGRQQDIVLLNKGAERNLGKILKYTCVNDDICNTYEQQYIATSQKIQMTGDEIKVVRNRISKCTRDCTKIVQPLSKTCAKIIKDTVEEQCSCPLLHELTSIAIDTAKDELHRAISKDTTDASTQSEDVYLPQGNDDVVENNVEQQKTTTFVDVNEMHIAEHMQRINIDEPFNATTDLSLTNFLSRPYVVGTYTWTSAQTYQSNLFTMQFPYALTNIPNIQNKISNIAFWAPDIEITIRANTTIFHYGSLSFCWVPQAVGVNMNGMSLMSTLNSKNWVQLLANSRQVLRFNVPFTHYKNKLTLGRETVGRSNVREDLFTLYCYVSWPLATAQTGTVAPVNVQVIARIVKPRLSGFTIDAYTPQGWENNLTMIDDDEQHEINSYSNTHPQVPNVKIQHQNAKKSVVPSSYHGYKLNYNHVKRRRARGMQEQGGDAEAQAASGGLISTTILKVADFMGKFSFIPLIGEIAAPMSAITAVGGYFAKWMGFGMTPNLDCTESMQVRAPHLMKWEDTPNVVTLAPNTGLVAKDFDKCNSFPNEMSIDNFIGSPGCIYTGQILATYSPGQVLFRRAISPREMFYGDYNTPAPFSAVGGIVSGYGHYMLHASTYAKAWRGGIQFFFTPICTQFHSCRVAIVYQPYTATDADSPTTITLSNFTNALNLVIDIQSGQTYSFVVPYDQCQDFLKNPIDQRVGVATKSLIENNGYITIILINELTSVITTPTSIGFQIFAKPCGDFQFLGIQAPSGGTTMPQGVDDVEMCDYPASSIGCLNTVKPFFFGKTQGYKVHDIHASYELTSFKQLANLHSPLASTTLPTTPFTFSLSDPVAIPWVSSSNGLLCASQYFRYHRGGFRMSAISTDVNLSGVMASGVTDATSLTDMIIVQSTTSNFNQPRAAKFLSSALTHNGQTVGFYISSLASRTPLDATVPFYSTYKCLPMNNTIAHNNTPVFNNAPLTSVAIGAISVAGTAGAVVNYLVSGADDFILGWILPTPPYRWTLSAGTPSMPKMSNPHHVMQTENIVLHYQDLTDTDIGEEGDPIHVDARNKTKEEIEKFVEGIRVARTANKHVSMPIDHNVRKPLKKEDDKPIVDKDGKPVVFYNADGTVHNFVHHDEEESGHPENEEEKIVESQKQLRRRRSVRLSLSSASTPNTPDGEEDDEKRLEMLNYFNSVLR